MLVIGKRIGN